MVGNDLWVVLWLAVGVAGLVVGLVWLRSVERSQRPAALRAVDSAVLDGPEPDVLAG